MVSAMPQPTVVSNFGATNSQLYPVSRSSSQVCSLKPSHLGTAKVFHPHTQVSTPVRRPNFRVHAIKDPSSQDSLKRAVAQRAIELVKSGMVVGLGTGSTSSMAIEELGKLISQNKLKDVVGVGTSYQSRVLARQFGVKTVNLNDVSVVDIAFDGADEASTRLAEKPHSTKLEWEKPHVFWADRIGLRVQMCRSSFEEINSNEAFVDEQDRITGALQIGVIGLRRPASWVCFGGGARPRRPRVWKTKVTRGTEVKSRKLVDLISTFSSSKEEVYGGLDAWCAWELEFPLITVKKALKIMQKEGQWKRVIQVTKWMLSKGQGKTNGTFLLLLQALDHEGRVEEADVVWEKLLTEYEDCTPRDMFACVLAMFERHNQPKRLLQVFADMEELEVRPDLVTVQRIARTYEKLGLPNRAKQVIAKYPPAKWVQKMHNGRHIRLKVYSHERDNSEKSGWITDDENTEESDGDEELTLDEEIDANNRHDKVDTLTMSERSPH